MTNETTPIGLDSTDAASPEAYRALYVAAAEILQKTGTVEVAYESLGAGFLNIGITQRLSKDLRAPWRRCDSNAVMIFGA
jgi:hypothetical protein